MGKLHTSSMVQLIANFLGHASGKKPFESARCCKSWLIVARRVSEEILPDASSKKFANLAGLEHEIISGAPGSCQHMLCTRHYAQHSQMFLPIKSLMPAVDGAGCKSPVHGASASMVSVTGIDVHACHTVCTEDDDYPEP